MAVQLHMESVTCVGLGLSLDSPLTEQAVVIGFGRTVALSGPFGRPGPGVRSPPVRASSLHAPIKGADPPVILGNLLVPHVHRRRETRCRILRFATFLQWFAFAPEKYFCKNDHLR